jgi:hypothetical protein
VRSNSSRQRGARIQRCRLCWLLDSSTQSLDQHPANMFRNKSSALELSKQGRRLFPKDRIWAFRFCAKGQSRPAQTADQTIKLCSIPLPETPKRIQLPHPTAHNLGHSSPSTMQQPCPTWIQIPLSPQNETDVLFGHDTGASQSRSSMNPGGVLVPLSHPVC